MELRQTLYLTIFSCLSCRAGSVVISCLPFGVIDVSITVGTFCLSHNVFLILNFHCNVFLLLNFCYRFLLSSMWWLSYIISRGFSLPKCLK